MIEWLFIVRLATGDLFSWPADPYMCRRHELRVALRLADVEAVKEREVVG